MEEKKNYQKLLEAQLAQWEIEIEKLNAQAQKAKVEVRLEYLKQIDELKKKQEVARSKLTELKGSAGEAWQELKAGAEHAFDELKKAFSSAKSKFK